jgi:hypothetical protein
VAEKLGRVNTYSAHQVGRGADVTLRVTVPAEWLNLGRTIEIELPRNLVCARCRGGGCNTCNQSGAITLRGKTELSEVVQVALPLQKSSETSEATPTVSGSPVQASQSSEHGPDSQPRSARPVLIRIPECGGLPDATKSEVARGWLFLEVGLANEPSQNVRCIDDDDEPLSSSKMLRAELRPNEMPPTGDSFAAVNPPLSSRVPKSTNDNDEAPPSRVARVGAEIRPESKPVPESKAVVPAQQGAMVPSAVEVSSSTATVRARTRAITSAIYLGIVVVTVLLIFLLILL